MLRWEGFPREVPDAGAWVKLNSRDNNERKEKKKSYRTDRDTAKGSHQEKGNRAFKPGRERNYSLFGEGMENHPNTNPFWEKKKRSTHKGRA